MAKKVYFYIDDVIFCLRDITRQKPKSLFDNPYFKGLKEAHDKYGMKVQLNLFARLDFFYGRDEFHLDEVTDAYKEEFAQNSDWLKFCFHSRQEFPDYPYINASYEDVKVDFDYIKNNVFRFASEDNFTYGCCTHWRPISKEGCRALRDGGIKVLNSTYGVVEEYNDDPSVLPYGHSYRLLQNRKPETKLFTRDTCEENISRSICTYNHMTPEQQEETYGALKTVYNEEFGLHFKSYMTGLLLNICDMQTIKEIAEEGC